MKLRRLLAAIFLSLMVLGVGMNQLACAHPTTITTPQGAAAFTANEILTRVERLQDAAMAAQKNGSLPLDTARAIVFATVSLAEVADAATQGWQAAARQIWVQAKTDIPALRSGGQLALVAATIDEALGGGQ